MATTVATLVAKLVADTSQFRSGLASADSSVAKSKKSMAGLGAAAGSMGKMLAGGAAIGGAVVAFHSLFEEMKQSAVVTAQTNAVLKSTGGLANVTAKEVKNLASAISEKSGLDDEAIQSAENLLLTFKNVRNEAGQGADVFNRATEAAVDLSVAGFGDMTSTAKMLGKALNDPIVGMTALSRAGVTFTASQKETIKGLVDSGNLLGAQKLMLKEVESQVGGSAEAYGNTFPGAIGKAKEALLNFGSELVGGFVPFLQDAASGLSDVTSAANDLANGIGIGGGGLSGAFEFVNKSFNPVMLGISGFKGAMALAKGDAQGLEEGVIGLTGPIGQLAGQVATGDEELQKFVLDSVRARDGAKGHADSERGRADSLRLTKAELIGIRAEAEKFINAQLGLQGALLNVEAAQKGYAETLVASGAGSLEARQAQLDLTNSVVAAGQAAFDASGKTSDQIATLNFLKGTLDGPAAQAINSHIARLLGIPESRATNITADAVQALLVIQQFQDRLNALPASVTVAVNAQATGFAPGVGAAIGLTE